MSLRDKLKQAMGVVGARLKPCAVGPGTEYPSFRAAECESTTRSGRYCAATIEKCNIPLEPANTPWTQIERSASYDPEQPADAFVSVPAAVGERYRDYCASVDDLQRYVEDQYCGGLLVEEKKKRLRHLIRKTHAAANERVAEVEGRTFKAATARKLLHHLVQKHEKGLERLKQRVLSSPPPPARE